MNRNIFEVYAKIIDANGAYNTLSGYPKIFDSRNYNNDIEKTLKRARGEFYDVVSTMCKRDDRQLQTVILMTATGHVIECQSLGSIQPDPEPEQEEVNENEST